MDQMGENLNRYYGRADPVKQPSIFAATSLIEHYASNKKLCFYLDLHAHASKRGCFIYGNVLDDVNDQIQNQLYCKLVSMNTAHFEYEACLFSREHMKRTDPGDMHKGTHTTVHHPFFYLSQPFLTTTSPPLTISLHLTLTNTTPISPSSSLAFPLPSSLGLTAEGSGRVATYLSHNVIHRSALHTTLSHYSYLILLSFPLIFSFNLLFYVLHLFSMTSSTPYSSPSFISSSRPITLPPLSILRFSPSPTIPPQLHLRVQLQHVQSG